MLILAMESSAKAASAALVRAQYNRFVFVCKSAGGNMFVMERGMLPTVLFFFPSLV